MENEAISSSPEVGGQPASKRQRPLKAAWKAIRKPLAQSRIVKAAIVGLFTAGVRGVIAQGLIARIRALLKGNATAVAPAPVAETALAPIEHGRRDLTR